MYIFNYYSSYKPLILSLLAQMIYLNILYNGDYRERHSICLTIESNSEWHSISVS